MDTLFDKLEPEQKEHAKKIAAFAHKAQAAFRDFHTDFESTEKPWSIPWLNDFGVFIAHNPDAHSNEVLELVLGQGLVEHHGAKWGIAHGLMGVFHAQGNLFSPVTISVEQLKSGAFHADFGSVWINPCAGDREGAQLYPDLGQPGREGFTSPGQYTVGMYRNMLFNAALRLALNNPAMRLQDVTQLAALSVADEDPEVAVALYNRALELGMEPIDEVLNQTLEDNGRIPLI